MPALVRELIKDVRRMMSPYTALKLKERKSNKLKDFVALSGTLGVSHMLCFSTTETGTYLRLAKFPRGPTLHFQVEQVLPPPSSLLPPSQFSASASASSC